MNVNKILTPKIRRWLYGIAIAFVPFAIYQGWLEPEALPIVVPLIIAVFNVQGDPSGTVTTFEPENGDGR